MTVSRYKHEKSFVAEAKWGPLQGTKCPIEPLGSMEPFRALPSESKANTEEEGFQGTLWDTAQVLPSNGSQRLALGGGGWG